MRRPRVNGGGGNRARGGAARFSVRIGSIPAMGTARA